jgi:hypothetical protein
MNQALRDLPAHLRKRLAAALETGMLARPYSATSLHSVLGVEADEEQIVSALTELDRMGIAGPAASAWSEAPRR